MNMIEKVARAMAASDSGPIGSTSFEFHWAEVGHEYMHNAKAAIEAMRDPTEAMTTAGVEAWRNHYLSPVTQWRAMIDAALTESG